MTMMVETMAATGNEWEEQGLCRIRQVHPNLMEDYGPDVKAAKRMCITCPVRQICLDRNIDEPWGIWGALNTVERRAYKGGARPRLCDGCGLLFARNGVGMCVQCHRSPLDDAAIARWAGDLAQWVEQGLGDGQIAALIQAELGDQHIRASHVRSMRARLDMPSASIVRKIRAQAKPGKRRKSGYAEASVNMAEERGGELSMRELTFPEQVELMRRWCKKGGTRTTFSKRFGMNGSRVRELYEAAYPDGYKPPKSYIGENR